VETLSNQLKIEKLALAKARATIRSKSDEISKMHEELAEKDKEIQRLRKRLREAED